MYRSNHTPYNDQHSTHHKTSTNIRSHWNCLWCKICRHEMNISPLSLCHHYCTTCSNATVHRRMHAYDSSQKKIQVSLAAIHTNIAATVSYSTEFIQRGIPMFCIVLVLCNVEFEATITPPLHQYFNSH